MGRPVLVSACRTPIGKFSGALSSMTAPQLGALAVTEALTRAGLAADAVEEVLMGCVLQANLGQSPARQVLRGAGIPDEVGAVTINKVCGSGLKAVMLAAQAIKAGDMKAAVAGGMESMSNVPYYLPNARAGQPGWGTGAGDRRDGPRRVVGSLQRHATWATPPSSWRGSTRSAARSRTATRPRAIAAPSRRRVPASSARRSRRSKCKGRKGKVTVVDTDEGPRADTTAESLGALRPAFQREGGTVTAGNASSINDGASALVVDGRRLCQGARVPRSRWPASSAMPTGGMAPEWVMMAPEVAVRKLCDQLKCTPQDFDLVELNEAFAVQLVALTASSCELDPDKVNVNGGGRSPGASDRLLRLRGCLTTLLHAHGPSGTSQTGMAALCLGGGNAVAMSVAVERMVVT